MPDLYGELGVAKDADDGAIKRAHRKRVSKTHPDVPGGGADEFRRVQHAYLVLSDPERRKRYDETGEEGDAQRARSPEEMEAEEATQILGAMVASLINDPGIADFAIDHTDLRQPMHNALAEASRGRKAEIAGITKQIARAERMAKKWKRKRRKKGETNAPDLIGAMFVSQITSMRQRIEANERAERINGRIKAMLDGYEYEHEPKAPSASPLASSPYADLGLSPMFFAGKRNGWR